MSILFRRGFLLGAAGPRVEEWTAHWCHRDVAGQTLRHDPLVPYHACTSRGLRLHSLGLICDVFAPGLSDEDVVAALAADLRDSWAAFYASLKRTGGAYVLFIEDGEGVHVVLDATGTVPVCHGFGTIASHPRLIAETQGLTVSPVAERWFKHKAMNLGGRYMPGLLTAYDGIEILTPNQRLHDGRMTRFYPDADCRERHPDEIVETVAPALSSQLSRSSERLAFSLSGGMDSRLTLAASRPVAQHSLYFTYYGDNHPVFSNDIAVVRQLRDALGLEHREARLSAYTTPPDFAAEFAINGDGMQGPAGLAYWFAGCVGADHLHVRSNILETVRGYYLKNALNHKDAFDALKLARLFRQATAEEFTPYFQDFIDKAQFTHDACRGFHYSDMFYWEHRLGGWLGPMIRGQRAVFETYIIYNSRALLELMMSRPLEDRANASIVVALIERLWPEVLDVPVFSEAKYVDLPGRLPKRGAP